jgi:hypothetical protein
MAWDEANVPGTLAMIVKLVKNQNDPLLQEPSMILGTGTK